MRWIVCRTCVAEREGPGCAVSANYGKAPDYEARIYMIQVLTQY